MVCNQSAAFDANTAAAQTAVAAVAGKRIVVYGYALVNGVATAQTIQFKSASTTNLSGVMSLPSAVGGGVATSSGDKDTALFMTNPGEALTITLSAATQVGGHIAYKLV
jgi:hypothetical protein